MDHNLFDSCFIPYSVLLCGPFKLEIEATYPNSETVIRFTNPLEFGNVFQRVVCNFPGQSCPGGGMRGLKHKQGRV